MSEGIKLLPNISHFLFAGNRFTEKGAKVLLSNIGKNTKVIDMARNHIGAVGCEYIYNIFMSKECRYCIQLTRKKKEKKYQFYF